MTTLTAVRAALEASASEQATLFTELLENGNNRTYKSLNPAKRKFGALDDDSIYVGKKCSLFQKHKAPSLEELQELCLRDLAGAREQYGIRFTFTTRPGSVEEEKREDEDADVRLINALNSTDLDATAGTLTFPSETLEEICSEVWTPPEGLLRATMATCTILPANTFLPLHHSCEGTTNTTLISGSILWFIWPSTARNLMIIQNAYSQLSHGNHDKVLSQAANDLEAGVIFVQVEGDGLQIPRLCPMMCLATQTAVLATHSYVTNANFVDMLHRISLLQSWFRTEVEGERKQIEFSSAFLRYLDMLLNGDDEDEDKDDFKLDYTTDCTLDTLFKIWDDVKDDLADMMGPADRIAMEKIWEAFLIAAKGRECRICGWHCHNKKRLMGEHFVEKHWVENVSAKHGEFMDDVEAKLGVDGIRKQTHDLTMFKEMKTVTHRDDAS